MKKTTGQILPAVTLVMVMMLIIIPAIVYWIRQDAVIAEADKKNMSAFNLAEAAVDRGMWKIKSSTVTWANAVGGASISGYNFDTTYTDVPGGTYRIKITTASTAGWVTVTGEGRDSGNKEVRAIQAIFSNSTLPGPMLATGIIGLSGQLEPHWGPVMAQHNIVLTGAAATKYFPRKFSKQVVIGTAGNPRDTNGINPPNTDSVEWWSDYNVPDLPLLDFATMRASATANGTLNYYNATATSHTLTGYPTPLSTHGTCSSAVGGNHLTHFYDTYHHPKSKLNLIWYWDGNVAFTGGPVLAGHSNGIWGTLIIRGNLTVDTEDNYSYTAPIPKNAWMEYAKITSAAGDTAAVNEYPGDNGYQKVRSSFNFGSENWTGGGPASYTDMGIRGFLYTGGDFNITANGMGDYNGVIWVVGNVNNANTTQTGLVMFDESVSVPVLNVILLRQSWQEVSPSTTTWP